MCKIIQCCALNTAHEHIKLGTKYPRDASPGEDTCMRSTNLHGHIHSVNNQWTTNCQHNIKIFPNKSFRPSE